MSRGELRYRGASQAIVACDDVMITVLRAGVTMDFLREVRRVAKAHASAWKGRTRTITLLEPGSATQVSDEVRAESSRLAQEYPTVGTALVVEGEGFGAAFLRTVLMGVYLFQRQPTPHKVFSRADDGVRWLVARTVGHASASPSEAELLAACELARASMG